MLSPPAPLISLHLLDISNDIRFKLFRRHTVCLYMHVYVCMRVCACTINVFNKGLQSRVLPLYFSPRYMHSLSILLSMKFRIPLSSSNPQFFASSFFPYLSSSGQRTKASLDKIPRTKAPRKKAPPGQKPLPTRTNPLELINNYWLYHLKRFNYKHIKRKAHKNT